MSTFDFFEKNPNYLKLLFIISVVLLGILLIVFLIAFIQGREVTIWPPKLGSKPIKDKEATPEKSQEEYRYTGFISEFKNAHEADSQAMSEASVSLDFLGVSSQFFYTREGFLKFASNRAISMRFLLLNPTTEYAKNLERLEGIPVRRNIITSARNLLDLTNLNPKIEVRFYSEEPLFRIIIIDGIKSYLGYYGATHNNPQVSFKQTKNGLAFVSPLKTLWLRLWSSSIVVDRQLLTSLESVIENE